MTSTPYTLFLLHLFLGLLLGPAPTVVTFGEAMEAGYCASSKNAWPLPKSISLHNPFIPSSCVSTKPKKPCGGELGMGLSELETSWKSVCICSVVSSEKLKLICWFCDIGDELFSDGRSGKSKSAALLGLAFLGVLRAGTADGLGGEELRL